MPKNSSNDTSPGEEVETNLAEMKKLLQQKCRLQKWKTVAHSSGSKCVRETVSKSESLHHQRKANQPEPSSHSRQDKVRKKPSLKWKFCHAVASVVAATSGTDARKIVDSPIGSASESDVEDSKPEVSAARASSANSKKKKKRKSAVGQKKSRRTSSASAVQSNSSKQTSSKKPLRG